MKLQGGRELRRSVNSPASVEEELPCFVLNAIVVDMQCVEKLGLITVQSSHIPEPCAVRNRTSA